MSDLIEKAAQAKEKMQTSNPSVAPTREAGANKRIPLSVPQRKLEVPGIPGYHLRWIRGTPQRIAQAERAGFEFVHPDEFGGLNDVSVGGDASREGNTDMGSRVSVVEGSELDGTGNAVRMYLMKQKMEFFLEDNAIIQNRNDSVADALTASFRTGTIGGPTPGEGADDVAARYVDPRRAKIPDLFRKKR
jgi:hypothetical protein